jgi:hypothetical protein
MANTNHLCKECDITCLNRDLLDLHKQSETHKRKIAIDKLIKEQEEQQKKEASGEIDANEAARMAFRRLEMLENILHSVYY